ncbi:MAG: DUF4147 domain-containing protein [Planctomycetaceae bacterium]
MDSSVAVNDAMAIWGAGVAAVNSAELVRTAVCRSENRLEICGEVYEIDSIRQIVVVGAGKAGAGMASGLESALGSDLVQAKVEGWINVPADCVRPLQKIRLHDARPAGVNEPTQQGVEGSERMREMVAGLQSDDLCIVLLSGGGSALMPLPVPGISLSDKLTVTRLLSRGGASIHELNAVRKRISRIKGGGLIRAAKAGRVVTLVISDVVGDPLDVIASGPTVCDDGTAEEALTILERFTGREAESSVPASVWNELRRQAQSFCSVNQPVISCRNCIIGNNETALEAAIDRANSLGYEVRSLGSDRQGVAREIGVELANLSQHAGSASQPVCWIGGGEPVVQLTSTSRPRKGGRNQEVALAALCHLWNHNLKGIAILSGGTDGEDGPTDAAGAICCEEVRDAARAANLDPFDALAINDSYTFFATAGGLLKTGPTNTNVMDLQVVVVHPQ